MTGQQQLDLQQAAQAQSNYTGMAGDLITVTWGEEKFSPVQYHSFAVGPFSITSKLLPGETYEMAYTRLWNHLDNIARTCFIMKRNDFYRRWPESHERPQGGTNRVG